MFIESVMLSNHFILCHPLLLWPVSGSFPMSRLFMSGGQSIGVCLFVLLYNIVLVLPHTNMKPPWEYTCSQYSGLISFRVDWFDFLAVQETFESLLQHDSSKGLILWHSAFMVQLSDPYMTTGKNLALIRRTFVGKVISLLFNMLSRFVMTFIPRSRHLLISRCIHCLQ